MIVTLVSITFVCDKLKFGSKESIQIQLFISLSYLHLFWSEGNWQGKKKCMYFILLDSSSVRKEFQRFLTIQTCDSWLLSSSVLAILACTPWGIEAYRKSTTRKKKGGEGGIRMLSMALERLVHSYSTQHTSVPKWDSVLSPAQGCQVFLYVSYTDKKEKSVLK